MRSSSSKCVSLYFLNIFLHLLQTIKWRSTSVNLWWMKEGMLEKQQVRNQKIRIWSCDILSQELARGMFPGLLMADHKAAFLSMQVWAFYQSLQNCPILPSATIPSLSSGSGWASLRALWELSAGLVLWVGFVLLSSCPRQNKDLKGRDTAAKQSFTWIYS